MSILQNIIEFLSGAELAKQAADLFSWAGKPIKNKEDKDNALFGQIIAKIYWSCLSTLKATEFLQLKSWFVTTSMFARNPDLTYFGKIFDTMSEKYLTSLSVQDRLVLEQTALQSNSEVRYIILAPLYNVLKNLSPTEKTQFIKQSFYDLLDEKSNPELAAEEYVSKNPLADINEANRVFHAWGNFCANLPQLVAVDSNKKLLFSYKQSANNRSVKDVSHDFLNDFINCIANQAMNETGGDTTGALINEATPVFIWMKAWLPLPDEDKLRVAVAYAKSPQNFMDAFLTKFTGARDHLKVVDARLTNETKQPGGLAHGIDSLTENLKRKREAGYGCR